MDEYIIKSSTLTGIGNAIRRKTGGTALIDPLDMESEIDGISGSGEQATPEISVNENGLITATAGDKVAYEQLPTQAGKTITPGPTEQIAVAAGKYVTGDIIIAAVQNSGGGGGDGSALIINGSEVFISSDMSVIVEDYEEPKTYALYNGVRLPTIPEDVLATYPYAFVVKFEAGTYHLYAGTEKAYYGNNQLNIPTSSRARYDQSGTAWALFSIYTTSTFFAAGTTLVWSNFDVPNGSPDSSTIYFNGTEPVPTD